MIERCTSEKSPAFADYGGRGIAVCSEWMGAGGFEVFFAHVGRRPSAKHSIDRIDNARGYEPGNVRWATRAVQRRNTRAVKLYEYLGRMMPLCDIASESGVPLSTLWLRIVRYGMPMEKATTIGRVRRKDARRT